MKETINMMIGDIADPDIQSLIGELHSVTGVDPENHFNTTLLFYLQMCLYSNGGGKPPVPISKDDLDTVDPMHISLLRRKVAKLGESELYRVCMRLAAINRVGIEQVENKSLYVFLNQSLKVCARRKRQNPRRLFA